MPTRERYTITLGADPAEIARVRQAVHDLALRHGFGERAADLVLALDEVVANAQEHGRAPVAVRAEADGWLVIEVSDVGNGFNRGEVWRTHPPSPANHRGRGLWIARQLADLVEISIERDRTTVRLELSPDPHIGA